MRHFISLGLIMLLTSCANTITNYYPQTVHSWHGANAQKLVKTWGWPDQTMSLKDGNTVYVYKSTQYRPGVSAGGPDCIAMFEVNKQEIITHTQYKGKRCWRDQNFAYYMSYHS